MRKVIEFFIKNAIFTHTLFLVVVLLSFIAYKHVPKELFPPSTLDKIVIEGSYPGAGPEVLNKIAVAQIEDKLKSYQEISLIESVISSSHFSIIVSLKPNSNKLELLNEFKTIIADVKKDLPSDMNEPTVSILKKAFPLMFISVASDKLSKDELLNAAEDIKTILISNFKDLSKVDIRGKSDKNIYIELNNGKIEALHLNKNSVISALSSIATIFPIGKIEDTNQYFVSMKSLNIDELKNSIIQIGNVFVRLSDIATIKEDYETPIQIGKFNGITNLTLDVRKGETGDAIKLSEQIREILKDYHNKHKEVILGVSTDTSKWVRNRFNTVVSNILFGLILVFFIMWLFLNLRISFVVTLGIPTSFAIALIFLDYFNYSLNLLSLLGALIALGMIVDEAIVVGENIYRHLEMGKDKFQAAIDGASEVFWPVFASAMTTILAFLPLLLIKGEIGVFIKILPIMISILILSSLIEAFIFLPLHSKEVLKVEYSTKEELWFKFNLIYKRFLEFIFRYKFIFLALFLILIPVLTVIGIKHSKFQLFPDFDTSQIYINGKLDSNYTIYDTSKAIEKIENLLKRNLGNDIESFTTVVGMKMNTKGEANTGDNYFHIFVDLKDKKPTDFYNKYIGPLFQPIKIENQTRTKTAKEIAFMLKKELSGIQINDLKELNVIVPQAGVIKSDIVIQLSSTDKNLLINSIKELEDFMYKLKGVYNIYDDAEFGADELKLSVNDYGKKLGFTQKYIFSILRGFFAEAEYSKTFNNNGINRIILRDLDKDKLYELKHFRINIPNSNQYIELSKIVDFHIIKSFKKINKYNGVSAKTVYATLNKKIITTSDFYKKVEPLLNKIKSKGVKIIIGGAAKTSREFKRDVLSSMIVAVLMIFLVLVLMFNSFILPFVVISVIPLSFLGVVLGNLVMDMNMTMLGMIGIVGLAGVVVNDGIVMIDFIKRAKNLEELLDLASFRLRPILLTSLTTFFGLITLIFFPFGQSAILQPLAIALGFGIIFGTILNLFYLPLFYYILNKKKIN